MKKITLSVLLSCTLIACTPSTATRGNYLFEEDIQTIQPITSTEFDVLNILGTPTTKAVFDENIWYYVGLKTEKESFFDEKVTEKRVYKITFDENKFVQSITEVTDDGVDVPIAGRVTPTSGREMTVVQQILGNIGKFNPPRQE